MLPPAVAGVVTGDFIPSYFSSPQHPANSFDIAAHITESCVSHLHKTCRYKQPNYI